jgi:hypothetical protein
MFTLFDLVRAAQGGAALNNMARQFGLSLEQTQRAMEAMMPAFALAFQRNAGDPMGLSNLVRMMTSGQYAGFFDNAGHAFTPDAMRQGNEVVRQLFGPEVSREIERQAAAWAGIAPEIMRQMLPATAAILMGGLFRSAVTEGLADFFERTAEALRGERRPARREERDTAAASLLDPFGVWQAMSAAMTGTPPKEAPERKPDTAAEQPNPFAAWAEVMNAMLVAGKPAEAPPPEPAAKEPPAPASAFFGRMFEAGIEAQQQQLAALQNIFDTYWGAEHKRR